MILHEPEVKHQDDEIVISTRIETQRSAHIPETLWFRFPESYTKYISGCMDGFLCTLLLTAMSLGEPLVVRGPVSLKLAQNLPKFQDAYQKANPNLLQVVDIQYSSLMEVQTDALPDACVTAFSGGVDSFYVVWSHLNPDKAPYPTHLTHGLFVHGFDILLKEAPIYDDYFQRFERLFRSWNLELLRASSNFYHFTQYRLDWFFAHYPALVGAALVLGGKIKHFYKPGGYEILNGVPRLPGYWVHLLSTETMTVELHAGDRSRLQKLPVMVEWDDFRNNLRVCMHGKKTVGKPVCDRCEKCLNTSLVLELWGIREKFPDFARPFSALKFARMCWNSAVLKDYRYLILDQAKKIGRYDLILLYWLILPFNLVKESIRKRLVALLPPNIRYAVKRVVYRYQRLEN